MKMIGSKTRLACSYASSIFTMTKSLYLRQVFTAFVGFFDSCNRLRLIYLVIAFLINSVLSIQLDC